MSVVAAALTALITFLPAWYAHVSVNAGLAPVWLYASIAGLVGVGGLMVLAFLRKAKDGVSPLRDRRRK
jgi:hypothetical protein